MKKVRLREIEGIAHEWKSWDSNLGMTASKGDYVFCAPDRRESAADRKKEVRFQEGADRGCSVFGERGPRVR